MGNMVPIQLFFIIVLALVVLYYFFEVDGFEGFTDAVTAQSNYVLDRLKVANPIGVALIAGGNEGALGTSADPLLATEGNSDRFPLYDRKSGLFATISMCEAIKTNTSGTPFDDPNFAANCGICLDIGTDSTGKSSTGGLVLLEKERKIAQSAAVGNAIPNYKATVGTCPANRLVSTKAQWLRLTKKLQCERQGSYDLDQCSQCFDDQSYTTVDQTNDGGVVAGTGTLYLVGSGKMSYSEQGFGSGTATLSSTPYVIYLQGPETTRVTIKVLSDTDKPASLAGYLSGTTQSGLFTIDLYRLVLTDTVTGRRPRTQRPMTLQGVQVSAMSPGFGKQQMVLSLNMPFTFVDPTSEEAGSCLSSPFITKKASAEFLNSDPCYSKDSGPGNFNLDCLQALFLSNGCTEKGKAYPNDPVSAAALMVSKGQNLSLSEIASIIYDNAVSSSTGMGSGGSKLKIEDWSRASQFCTGKVLTSPCDADPNTENGPLSLDCISYLWNNNGAIPDNSPYNVGSLATSLNGNETRFCQTSGTMSPLKADGSRNNDVIQYWQSKGGLTKVKKAMNLIHTSANSTSISDKDRLPYLKECYGITKIAPTPIASSEDLPESYTCKRNTIIGKLHVTQNFTLSFDITPTSGPFGDWASIIHFTSGNDCCDLGSRAPGIWFAPNTLNEFAVHVGHSTDGSWASRPTLPSSSPDYIQVGKTTPFKLRCKGPNISITIGSTTFNDTHDGSRFKGFVTVYGGDSWYRSANVDISNLSYVPG